MLKTKHLLHPLRTASVVKQKVLAYAALKRLAIRSNREFRDDARYDLESVADGFVSRIDYSSDDSQLLDRICASYIKTVERQHFAPEIYQATDWWRQVRASSLRPAMHALETRDIPALGAMYRNFFRDSCGAGLIGGSYGVSKAYFGRNIKDLYRQAYLGDALYTIDYWKKQIGGCFRVSDLAGPEIGNPFGAFIEGTLVRAGAVYQHYCAQRIVSQLDSESDIVAEIGGGFGGMAYYLLRDRAGVKYLGFDVPESIALTSYYLLKAFPRLRFLLYGEKGLTNAEIAEADVVLMPLFEMEKLSPESVDVTFSSHAMSDLSHRAMGEYLRTITRTTRKSFLYAGNFEAARLISVLAGERGGRLRMVEARSSGWHAYCYSGASEIECLYHLDTTSVKEQNDADTTAHTQSNQEACFRG